MIVRLPRKAEIIPRAVYTVTVNPSSYDSTNSHYASVSSSQPITNGYADDTSTTYAEIRLTTGSRAVTDFYYTFNLSTIPANAVIKSVTCKVKLLTNGSTSYTTAREVQLCTGTTPKGEATTGVSSSATTYELTAGTWTRAELQSAAIRLYAVRGTSSTTTQRYFRFYGATLTVEYEV